ncbi:MAG: U32 family peptidase [Clostridia bacterium]|nr:U32 family peptidase [Clostridia bacterium]
MKETRKKPELLCPAGSPDALAAAIEGGADAVYMGGVAFNARIHAKNFTEEELKKGIALAHSYGVKIYLTANTLIYDRELEDALRAAEDAYLAGADGLIVADMGLARRIRERIPIELHASTQLSGHNADAARFLSEAGFSRMVCAREMGREELSRFVKESPIEAEVFVHGALCVCHSGQCLFSSVVGGRSGNRGECAQPCRLPYRGGRNGYPLSLKDLSLAAHTRELCDMGIASFKIEGRMKSPEYVRDVARVWRRLIDEHRNATEEEMRELSGIFSRGGLTDGYYRHRIDGSMMGIRSEGDKQSSRELAPFRGIERKLPISLFAKIRLGKPATLTLTLEDGRSATAEGPLPETARSAPMDRDTVLRSLSRFGNTAYTVTDSEVELDTGLMMPVSAMNALRRSAAEALDALRNEDMGRSSSDLRTSEDTKVAVGFPREGLCKRTAVFYKPEEIPEEAYRYFDIQYVPLDRYTGSTNGVLLPPVIFDTEREEAERLLARACALGAEHVLVGNPGHIALARKFGLKLHGDFRLNVTNRQAAKGWMQEGIKDVLLSPELTLSRMRDLGGRVIVYGRLPLMVTEKCLGKEVADCDACKRGTVKLTDRRRAEFPVLREWQHRSLILNSVPLYMADRAEMLTQVRLEQYHFLFTTERADEIRAIIRAYERGIPPTEEIRRMK